MPDIIKGTRAEGGRLVADDWTVLAADASLDGLSHGKFVVPFARWLAVRRDATGPGVTLGVVVEPEDNVRELHDGLERLSLVAITFPVFTDGRGYSQARLVRERLGFKGELRAVGDVLCDQIFYMLRAGFDAFALKPGKSVADALAAYADFSTSYQAGADEPQPLYRRRLQGTAAAGQTP